MRNRARSRADDASDCPAVEEARLLGLEELDLLVFDPVAGPCTVHAGANASVVTRDASGNRVHYSAGSADSPAPSRAVAAAPPGVPSPRELSAKYGLSERHAELVASGKLTLRTAQALQAKTLRAQPDAPQRRRSRFPVRILKAASLGFLAIAAAWMLLQVRHRSPSEVERAVEVADAPVAVAPAGPVAPTERRAPERLPPLAQNAATVRTDVRLDDSGRLVRVGGPTPQAVVLSYCRVSGACRMTEPLEVASSDSGDAGLRFGLYIDAGDGVTPWAIQVNRDPATRAWVAGDGRRPITVFDAAKLRLGAERLRIEDLAGMEP